MMHNVTIGQTSSNEHSLKSTILEQGMLSVLLVLYAQSDVRLVPNVTKYSNTYIPTNTLHYLVVLSATAAAAAL